MTGTTVGSPFRCYARGVHVFTKSDAVVRQKPWFRWLLPLGLLVISLSAIPSIASISLAGVLLSVGVYFLALVGVWRLQQLVWRAVRADVRADANGLTLGDRSVLPRTSIGGIHVATRKNCIVVRVDRRWDAIEIVVDSVGEGTAVVEAMCLDARQTLSSYWFNDGTRRRGIARVMVMLVGLLSLVTLAREPILDGPPLSPTTLLALVIASAVSAYLALTPSLARVTVGGDGLRVWRRDFRPENFVPYLAIERVDVGDGEVTISITGRAALVLSIGGSGVSRFLLSVGRDRFGEGDEQIGSFVRRVEENLRVHRARVSPDAAFLDRSNRLADLWLHELAQLSEGRTNYRVPAMPAETLWRVVEDAASPATQRAGAAVVLCESLDEIGRARLRAVAETCACPRLQRAIKAAGENDVDAMRDAVDKIEDFRIEGETRGAASGRLGA